MAGNNVVYFVLRKLVNENRPELWFETLQDIITNTT